MVRTPCYDKTGLKKGAWTPEEDKKLVAYVTRYGHWNWRELPKFAGLSRCGKSCRLRWMNYLRPNIKIGNFSREEEETIIKMHQALGNKWATIAAKLPGRTDNEIKNHWHTKLKKQFKQYLELSESKPDTSFERGSEGEVNNKQQLELSPSVLSPLSHQILESSPLSLLPPLSGTDSMYGELTGDFWTEPYVAGTFCIQENFEQTSWVDPEIQFPAYPMLVEDYYCAYGSYEDNYMGWFN